MNDPATPTSPFIVFGDDVSPGSDLAWLWLISQRWPGWSLINLRASTHVYGAGQPAGSTEPTPLDAPAPRITPEDAGFADVGFLTMTADPRLALETWPDAALIVVGGSASGAGPYSIGSTTEWLLHDSSAPVLVARRGRAVRRVLVCADGSEHAAAAARALAAMPWADSVEATVVAVDDGRVDVTAAIDGAVDVVSDSVSSVVQVRRSGRSPHKEILALAQEIDADLIVVGTHGLSMMRRLTLGSTAGAIARRAETSVLAARTAG